MGRDLIAEGYWRSRKRGSGKKEKIPERYSFYQHFLTQSITQGIPLFLSDFSVDVQRNLLSRKRERNNNFSNTSLPKLRNCNFKRFSTSTEPAATRNSIAKFSLINPHAKLPEASCLPFQKPPHALWAAENSSSGRMDVRHKFPLPWERNGKDAIIVLGVIGGDGGGLNSRGVLVFLKEEGKWKEGKILERYSFYQHFLTQFITQGIPFS
ncbi:hypothetical protein CEXT_324821 [Caerostris extrusa]|uniref:Uncharacterized protein n=1 Tax=Caerostris extrusa TaxID=172846 RepID=A0AAV4WH45_CAEEX|nr:hypothetical protein CEXT_324821 [Caerostris extrusa]